MLKIRPGKKRRTIKIRVKPKRSRPARPRARSSGKMPIRTLKPSNGGIGIRLNRARPRFRTTPVLNISEGTSRKIIARNTAIKILVAGPARAVRAVSFLGSRKLKGSMGTGLAAPKMIPAPVKNRIKGRPMVIKGSI